MSAGDFYIRRNNAETDNLPDAGNISAGWDTEVYDEGSIVTYSDPNLQVDTGIYLIMYSEHFTSGNTTNNERIEIQGEIHVSGTGVVGGYGQNYLRKNNVGEHCIVSGQMILEVASDNTDIFIYFYRSDTSTDNDVHRVAGLGGVTILELDDSDNYGFYSNSSSQTVSGTSEVDIVLNTNDRQDTGFSRSGNAVTISSAGQYLATYTSRLHQTGNGREDYSMHLEIGTTKIVGTSSYTYCRGQSLESCQDGACTWIGIIDVSANDVITLRGASPSTSFPGSILAGTVSLQFWQLPSGADTAIIEATTGDFNASGTFDWDTSPHIDTASFTYTNGNSNIDVDQNDHLLAFGTLFNELADSPQRAIPKLTFLNTGVEVNHTGASIYHRNSNTDGVSVNIAGLIPLVASGEGIEVNIEPWETTGTLTNDSGQFSVLSLESIWSYTYDFPIVINDVDTDEEITNTQQNVVISGISFGATQSTGKVELVENDDYTGTKVEADNYDSWSDTSIQVDIDAGALANTYCYLFVTNASSDQAHIAVKVGAPPQTYEEAIQDLNPDHLWMLDNDYLDTGTQGDRPLNNAQDGNPAFTTDPICRSVTYSMKLDGDDSTSPANSDYMNLGTHTRRVHGGWFMIDGIQTELACVYEEGAQINNYCIIIGLGNKILCQAVDDGGFNIQVYGDQRIEPLRPYHLCFEFSGSGYQNIFKFYIDGVAQTRSFGNPPGLTTMPAHSGNIEFGGTGTTLEVGGTDITFAYVNNGHYNGWATWTDAAVIDSDDIREILFEGGAVPTYNISSATEASMQTTLESYDDSSHANWPLTYKIAEPTDETNPTFTLTNQVFNSLTSCHLRWMGTGDLTIRNSGTSNLSTSLVSTPNSGTVSVIETALVKITAKDIDDKSVVSGARLLLLADSGGSLPAEDSVSITRSGTTATVSHTSHGLLTGDKVKIYGANQNEYNGIKTITVTSTNAYTYTVSGSPTTPASGTITSTAVIITGTTDVNGEIETEIDYTSDQPVTGYVRKQTSSPYYQQSEISYTVLSTGLDEIILLIGDE